MPANTPNCITQKKQNLILRYKFYLRMRFFNIGITKKYLSLYLKIALIVVVIIRGAMYQAAGGQ